MKRYLKIRPLDTLFFRNGKPFSEGEVSWTESSLLPNPSVVWGAIYSMMISHGLVDKHILKKGVENERKKELDKLKVGRIFLYEEGNGRRDLYLPAPLDIYAEKGKPEKQGILKLQKSMATVLSNAPMESEFMLKLQTDEKIEGLKNAFIETASFSGNSYLFQKRGNHNIKFNTHFIYPDYRVGIKRENETNTAEEGMLYRINAAQFNKDIYLLVEVKMEGDFKDNSSKLLKLGGESKACEVEIETTIMEKMIQSLDKKLNDSFKESQYARVYLNQPKIFESGTGLQELQAANFEVLAACLGNAQAIGGFDVLKNEPKPMQNAVPAGSVYFVKSRAKQSYQAWKSSLATVLESHSNEYSPYIEQFTILPLKEN